MRRTKRWLLGILAALALVPLFGCAGGGTMTEQQKEGVELRRYCERTGDPTKCVGFMGFA
jgi:hypothetical protein